MEAKITDTVIEQGLEIERLKALIEKAFRTGEHYGVVNATQHWSEKTAGTDWQTFKKENNL